MLLGCHYDHPEGEGYSPPILEGVHRHRLTHTSHFAWGPVDIVLETDTLRKNKWVADNLHVSSSGLSISRQFHFHVISISSGDAFQFILNRFQSLALEKPTDDYFHYLFGDFQLARLDEWYCWFTTNTDDESKCVPTNVAYLTPDFRHWTVVDQPGRMNERNTEILLNELIRLSMYELGSLHVHSSAASMRNNTILMLGSNFAGKTTTAMAFARLDSSNTFISGNSTYLFLDRDAGPIVTGSAAPTTLRLRSVSLFDPTYTAESPPLQHAIRGADTAGSRQPEDRIVYSQREVSGRLGAGTADTGTLRLVLDLIRDDHIENPRWQRLRYTDAVAALNRELFTREPHWFSKAKFGAETLERPSVNSVLPDSIPSFRVVWRPDRDAQWLMDRITTTMFE